jgi:folate-dependent tRNA-U54 methylase TrmFO/GidA
MMDTTQLLTSIEEWTSHYKKSNPEYGNQPITWDEFYKFVMWIHKSNAHWKAEFDDDMKKDPIGTMAKMFGK